MKPVGLFPFSSVCNSFHRGYIRSSHEFFLASVATSRTNLERIQRIGIALNWFDFVCCVPKYACTHVPHPSASRKTSHESAFCVFRTTIQDHKKESLESLFSEKKNNCEIPLFLLISDVIAGFSKRTKGTLQIFHSDNVRYRTVRFWRWYVWPLFLIRHHTECQTITSSSNSVHWTVCLALRRQEK